MTNTRTCCKLARTGFLSVYRDRTVLIVDFFIATSIPFIIQAILWSYAINSSASIAPRYSLTETYTYYAAALTLNRLNNAYDMIERISLSIHTGAIDCIQIKPVNFMSYNFLIFLGESLLYYIPPIVLAVAFYIYTGHLAGSFSFIAFLIPTQVLCFLLGFLMACVAFFTTRAEMILSLNVVLFGVMGGTLLPSSYWPPYLQTLIQLSPFRVAIGGPAELLVRPSLELGIELSLLCVFWITVLFPVARKFYTSCYKTYNSSGG